MPMDFPDMKSLKACASVHKFRQPKNDETESEYRIALADHVEPRDYIESLEIRNGVGWDRFTPAQEKDIVRRRFPPASNVAGHLRPDSGRDVK